MFSENPQPINQKQAELIKKLEKIRQEKMEQVQTKATDEKRNVSKQRKRKRNTNRQKVRKKAEPSTKTVQKAIKTDTPKEKRTAKKNKALLNQLSNKNDLSQAIILSEILSKPIALRKDKR